MMTRPAALGEGTNVLRITGRIDSSTPRSANTATIFTVTVLQASMSMSQ